MKTEIFFYRYIRELVTYNYWKWHWHTKWKKNTKSSGKYTWWYYLVMFYTAHLSLTVLNTKHREISFLKENLAEKKNLFMLFSSSSEAQWTQKNWNDTRSPEPLSDLNLNFERVVWIYVLFFLLFLVIKERNSSRKKRCCYNSMEII